MEVSINHSLCSASIASTPARVVVIGASAGGIKALMALLSHLQVDFPYPIHLVLHLSAAKNSELDKVLGKITPLRVKWAEDGEVAMPGTVYIAPRDRHLLIVPGDRIALSSAERVGRWRPAVDALFRSAAQFCGERVIAVVLSGAMWDGAAGIEAVWKHGGLTVVQDEITSEHFDMPAAALDLGHADVALNPQKIAEFLTAATCAQN
jgi:two-component system chemotaxis response regulator CheB